MKRGLGTFAKGTLATLAALALTARKKNGGSEPGNPSDKLRKQLCDIARGEEGNGEEPDYWLDAYGSVPPLGAYAWCGVFDLWCLRRCGLTTAMWRTGPKVYGFIYPCGLRPTREPQPGDIAYFTKNQHHAIVLEVSPTEVVLCNGNGTGGKVSIGTAQRSAVASFFSIQSLVDAKLRKIQEANS